MTRAQKQFFSLFTPSGLSAIVVLVTSLGLIGNAYFRIHNRNGALAEGLSGFRTVFNPFYHRLTDSLATNTIIGNLPLLLFWSLVGAFVYVVAVRIYTAFGNTANLQKTFGYTNVKRDSLVKALVINALLRVVALFSWFIYCALSIRTIFPKIIMAPTIGTAAINFLLLALVLHVHVIFIRLVALRARVF